MKNRHGKIYSLSSDEFKNIVNKCSTLKEILDYIGVSYRGHSYDTLKERLIEEGIKFLNNESYKKCERYKNINDVLIQNSPYKSTNNLKKRLIKEGVLNNVCNICGQLPEHMGKPLVLQLDHINGISDDNRLSNLQIICPQCHSQTLTYSGKNSKQNDFRISYFKKYKHEIIKVDNDTLNIIIGDLSVTYDDFKTLLDTKVAKDICSTYSIQIKDLRHICKSLKLKLRYKNRISKINITKDEMLELLESLPKEQIGKMFNVSGKAIGKKCKTLGIIQENKRGYWAKRRSKVGF